MNQDSRKMIPQIERHFKNNLNRSISAEFRKYRKHPDYSLIGDFIILATIVNVIKRMGIKLIRNKVLYAMNQSEELKEMTVIDKKELLDGLLKTSSVQSRGGINGRESV
jgi:hypothetical protein